MERSRPGQSKFREQVLRRDGACVVTGAWAEDDLEAAHLVPFADRHRTAIDVMDRRNGIMLRADLHALFDKDLLWFYVASDRRRVVARFSPSVTARSDELSELDHRVVPFPVECIPMLLCRSSTTFAPEPQTVVHQREFEGEEMPTIVKIVLCLIVLGLLFRWA